MEFKTVVLGNFRKIVSSASDWMLFVILAILSTNTLDENMEMFLSIFTILIFVFIAIMQHPAAEWLYRTLNDEKSDKNLRKVLYMLGTSKKFMRALVIIPLILFIIANIFYPKTGTFAYIWLGLSLFDILSGKDYVEDEGNSIQDEEV